MEEDNNISVYLPEEIVYSILVRLPANVLYGVMRYVCWLWYNIISCPDFVKAHLDRSTNNLVIRYWNRKCDFLGVSPIFKELSLSRLDLSDCIIIDSCDGLVLIKNRVERSDQGRFPFYIVNPITRQCVTYSCWPSVSRFKGFRLGRSISGVYKLLCYYRLPSENNVHQVTAAISVLTLGTGKDDDWRTMRITDERLSTTHNFVAVLTIGGCFYMVMRCRELPFRNTCDKFHHPSGFFILRVDLETEIVSHIHAPASCKVDQSDTIRTVSITGGCFSFLDYSTDKGEFCVWRLGSASSGEWDMVCKYKIEYLDQFPYGRYLKPLGWVVDGEVLAVCCLRSGVVFTYNVKTGNTTSIAKHLVKTYQGVYSSFYHAETLVCV